ncbi:MAG: hypothetical protein N2053_10760 [Chitinispirillaceae bacterium]|nr:hypothetical protein [Chitinispirillaceae bacterium]
MSEPIAVPKPPSREEELLAEKPFTDTISKAEKLSMESRVNTAAAIHNYKLGVRIPWDKLSDLIRGVLMPLHQDGADIEIQVFLKARSEKGITRATLEHKVHETLKQIGAEIIEETSS